MKNNISGFRITGYLLLLIAATLMILSFSYAKYTKKVNGTASAVVALWGSTSSTQSIDISGLRPGSEKEITMVIKNTKDDKVSEVTQDYSITLKTTGNLPLQYAIQGKSDSAGKGSMINNVDNLTFTNGNITLQGGSLPHTDSVKHTYTIKVKWPDEKKEAVLADEIDMLTLIVDAKQKQ